MEVDPSQGSLSVLLDITNVDGCVSKKNLEIIVKQRFSQFPVKRDILEGKSINVVKITLERGKLCQCRRYEKNELHRRSLREKLPHFRYKSGHFFFVEVIRKIPRASVKRNPSVKFPVVVES